MYKFTYRRKFWPFQTVLQSVQGHIYEPSTDKMWVKFAKGGGREILRWSECEATLGADWKALSDAHISKVGKPNLVKEGVDK